jgi:hypothetical protein
MKGLISFKCERPFLFDAVAKRARQRGVVGEWAGVVTPSEVLPRLDASFYGWLLRFPEFLAMAGRPDGAECDRLEAQYGDPTLWSAVTADRRLFSLEPSVYATNPAYRGFSHQELIRYAASAFRAAELVYERWQPQVVFLEAGTSVDEFALYRVAAVRGLRTLFITESRVRNRWFLCPDPYGVSEDITRTARALGAGQARVATAEERAFADEVLGGIRNQAERPKSYAAAIQYMSDRRAVHWDRVLSFPWTVARNVVRYLQASDEDLYVSNPARAVPHRIAMRVQVARQRWLTRWDQPVAGERFAYFPLQMQPETTTSVMAPTFLDQVNLIETIARALPMTLSLYVKEHPMMLGLRPAAYYRRLRQIPNVRLVAPDVPSHDLITRSALVLTITGTAAWEAAAIGTPAITFARTPFDGCKGIARFQAPLETLPQFVRRVLDGEAGQAFAPEDYLVAVLRHSFPADTIAYARDPGLVADAEIDRIVTALAAVTTAGASGGSLAPDAPPPLERAHL